jgi:cytochrome b involved in lipid metabolism
MKKYVTISMFIFWAVVVAVIVAGLISSNKNNNQTITGSTADATGTVSNITGVSPSVATLALSMTELAKHNSSSSCWLLISGKIYDVTNFIIQHPGGEGTILSSCGTDATVAFNTKDRPNGRPHSANANAMLADYFIGNLNQVLKLNSGKNTTTPAKTNSSTQAKPNAVAVPSESNDDEFDD